MIILDVRNKEDFNVEHLDGAINIDVSDLIESKSLEVPKDTPIITYCYSGGRSTLAKQILESAGFTNVTNGGGYENLKAKDF